MFVRIGIVVQVKGVSLALYEDGKKRRNYNQWGEQWEDTGDITSLHSSKRNNHFLNFKH